MAIVLTETWTGTTGAAWPAGWTTRRGTTTIQANEGRLTAPAGAYATGRVDNTGITVLGDTDLVTDLYGGVDGVEQYAYLFIDSDNGTATGNWEADNCYYLVVQYDAVAASGKVIIGQSIAGTVTSLQNVAKSLTGTTRYRVRFQRSGQQLRARVWTGTEPLVWDTEVTLTGTPLTGRVGLLAANGSAATARQFTYDNLTVSDMQATAVAGNVTAKVATGTSRGFAPGVAGAAVTGSKAATGAGYAPALTVTAGALTTAVRATGSSTAPAPVVTTGALITAAPATGTGAATPPTVTVGADIPAPTAGVTADSPTPTPSAGVTTETVTASSTATAQTSTPTAGATINARPGTGTGQAHPPTITATRAATIAAAVARISGHAHTPTIRLIDLRDLTLTIDGLNPRWATAGIPERYTITGYTSHRAASPLTPQRETHPLPERLEVQPV